VRGIAYGRADDAPVAEKIIHATFSLDGDVLTGADAPPERYQKPAGFSLTLGLEDAADAERIFGTLAEHGVVARRG
jgi:PhnB protein